MKRYIIVVGIMFLATLSLGCVEPACVVEVGDVSETNYTGAYTTEINEVVYHDTCLGLKRTRECTIITGKPVKIHFSDDRKDIIVFEDGIVVHASGAEAIIWQLGKVHNMTICCGWIEVVECVD